MFDISALHLLVSYLTYYLVLWHFQLLVSYLTYWWGFLALSVTVTCVIFDILVRFSGTLVLLLQVSCLIYWYGLVALLCYCYYCHVWHIDVVLWHSLLLLLVSYLIYWYGLVAFLCYYYWCHIWHIGVDLWHPYVTITNVMIDILVWFCGTLIVLLLVSWLTYWCGFVEHLFYFY